MLTGVGWGSGVQLFHLDTWKGPGLYLVAVFTFTAQKHLAICFDGTFLKPNMPQQTPILLLSSQFLLESLKGNPRIRCHKKSSLISFLENASFFSYPVSLKALTVTAGGMNGMNRLGRKSSPPPLCDWQRWQPALKMRMQIQIMCQGFFFFFWMS